MNKLATCLLSTVTILTAFTDYAQAAEPSEREMFAAMQQALQSRGGNQLGVRIERIAKVGCNHLAASTYRCAYRVFFAKGGNPLVDFATSLSNGKTINERVFTQYGTRWVMQVPN